MRQMNSRGLAQFTGAPRSLIWRGGAVHLRCATAPRDVPGPHAHFAIQLSVGITGQVSLRCGRSGPERLAPGWLVRSGEPHWLSGPGPGVTFFWAPLAPAGRLIATRLGGAGFEALSSAECAAIRREVEGCWERGWLPPELREAAGRVARLVAPPGGVPSPVDARVRAVLERLESDPAAKLSLAELAGGVRLSESRLAHLFRRDVGIPMRQYRLMLRMEQAAQEIAQGATLTHAAYAAGFSDPAHFCRICRRMFGSAPSELPALRVGE